MICKNGNICHIDNEINMKKIILTALIFSGLLFQSLLLAQTAPEADFSANANGADVRFKALLPPLPPPVPGGKAPFYTYFWEFGDHYSSTLESPVHRYEEQGEYTAVLTATLHYDDGKPLKKKKKKVIAAQAGQGGQPVRTALADNQKVIGLQAVREPRPGEEFTMTLSYQNGSKVPTDGQLYLFFNEKAFKTPHFKFQEARTHFGETVENVLSSVTPPGPSSMNSDWWMNPIYPHTGVSAPESPCPPGLMADEWIQAARRQYRSEQVWRFNDLNPGALRNLFITLDALPTMLKDTNAVIHLTAMFVPSVPQVAPEKITLEIEIVASHDPNLIAVSDHRANYRYIKDTDLRYKVRFQNNGEGPAKTIQLRVDVPKSLNVKNMQPLNWYPKCPLCPPQGPNIQCLDTSLSKRAIVFTFYGVYLPGSRQKGVADYDSTKGFVQYRVALDADSPKRAFSSRANIIFDKNPPVVTNFTKTRFKPGISPGIKLGYAFLGTTDVLSGQDRYFFMGASLAPYKSWRIYPQIEAFIGIQGRSAYGSDELVPTEIKQDKEGRIVDTVFSGAQGTPPIRGVFRRFNNSAIAESKKGEQGFIALELPLSLRKSLARWIGVGAGLSPRLILINGTEAIRQVETTTLLYRRIEPQTTPPVEITVPRGQRPLKEVVTPYRTTRIEYSVFGDIQLGAVRAGPSISVRGGTLLDQNWKPTNPFAQVLLEFKF
jgi:PKD domain